MTDHITALYCIVDDLLKSVGHIEDSRCKTSDSEIITTAIASAYYFSGNIEKSRKCMKELGFMPMMLGKSRFCRRLKRVKDLIMSLFHQLGEVIKSLSTSTKYLLDSLPVSVCDNIRIKRSRIVKGEDYRGYIASKRRYFYGVRVGLSYLPTNSSCMALLASRTALFTSVKIRISIPVTRKTMSDRIAYR